MNESTSIEWKNVAWFSKIATVLLSFSILITILYVSLLDLLPPTSRDALVHHLAIPKIWLKAGGFVETPWATFSYYPMNLALLYLVPLSFGVDWAAKFIHHGFGLATGLLIFFHLRQRLNLNWGLLGALVFLSTPMVMRLGSSAYVDLGLVFFFTAVCLSLIRWMDTERNLWLYLSALSMGLALGTKYQGLIGLPILTIGVFWLGLSLGKRPVKALGYTAIWCLLTCLVVAPWMIKNGVLTGNPFYPLFNSVGSVVKSSSTASVGMFIRREYLYGESFWDVFLIPLRFFYDGKDFLPRFFDGVLGPIYLIMSPLALIRPKTWELCPMGGVALFWIFLVYFKDAHVVRYLMPIIPLCAILVAYGFKAVWDWSTDRFNLMVGVPLILLPLCIFMAGNANWMIEYWNYMKPSAFLFHGQSREDYLKQQLPYFETLSYVNQNIPADARILMMFTGSQGYYLERDYFYKERYSGQILRPIIESSATARDIKKGILDMGATYLFIRDALLVQYLRDNFPDKKNRLVLEFFKNETSQLFSKNGYSLFRINK